VTARSPALRAAALVGAAIGIVVFRAFPDRDIALLGLHNHRYFAFHSALVPLLLFRAARGPWRPRWLASLAAGVAAGAAAAFAIHLFLDSFQSKNVVFPFVGSLIDRTSLDDRLWLLANAVASLALGVRVLFRGRTRRASA
jgi:hypothetical protein